MKQCNLTKPTLLTTQDQSKKKREKEFDLDALRASSEGVAPQTSIFDQTNHFDHLSGIHHVDSHRDLWSQVWRRVQT